MTKKYMAGVRSLTTASKASLSPDTEEIQAWLQGRNSNHPTQVLSKCSHAKLPRSWKDRMPMKGDRSIASCRQCRQGATFVKASKSLLKSKEARNSNQPAKSLSSCNHVQLPMKDRTRCQ